MSYNLHRNLYQFVPLSGQADYNIACSYFKEIILIRITNYTVYRIVLRMKSYNREKFSHIVTVKSNRISRV